MKTLALSRYIRARRRERGLTQDDLARAVGVTRGAIARYEANTREIPLTLVPALAAALEADPAHLEGLLNGVNRPTVPCVRERACITPLEGRLVDVARLPSMQARHDAVREQIGEGAYADLDAGFLRQTPWEVAVGVHALAEGATPQWLSPLEAGTRVLVVNEGKRGYEGHLLRLAVVWEGDDERLVLFPQVPILVPKIDKRYRVDYLVVHLAARAPASNVVVELDGGPHEFTRGQDEVRAEDLQLPLLRFDNPIVSAQDFWPRLVRAVREKAAAARVNDGEYARFLSARRKRYDSLRT